MIMTDQPKPQGQLSIQVVAMPADTNANSQIFGGWLVSHMDLAGSCESIRRSKSRTVTVAIDSLAFIKPVFVGDLVSCYSDIIKIGRTSMQIKVESWTLSLKQQILLKVAEGIFTYVAIDDLGIPQPVDR